MSTSITQTKRALNPAQSASADDPPVDDGRGGRSSSTLHAEVVCQCRDTAALKAGRSLHGERVLRRAPSQRVAIGRGWAVSTRRDSLE